MTDLDMTSAALVILGPTGMMVVGLGFLVALLGIAVKALLR